MDTREVTRKYRLNQWTQIISECRSSGQTVAVWCAENNIKPRNYYYWLRQVRTAACESLPSLCDGNNPIVPLNIPIPTTDSGPKDQESSAAIIIRFGSLTLEIRNNASEALIDNTLKALRHVR